MFKKIMIFIPSLEFGGAERVTAYLAKYFSKRKYIVKVVTGLKKPDKEYILDENVKRIVTKNIFSIRNEVKRFQPELILIMFAPMSIIVVPAIKGLHIPYIISERNDPNNFAGKRITKIIYQFFMKNADGLIFQTHDMMKYYEGKVRGEKRIIYNPLILDDFPTPYHGLRKKIITNVGRLHSQKNHKLLIYAFEEVHRVYPNYKLFIYGEGELRTELEELIKNLKLTNYVYLMGNWVDVLEQINSSELFVLSSNFEGMPNALIEAMALGVPCVSTDCPCGGAKELIQDHVNGTLVPVDDKERMKEAILELIENTALAEQYSLQGIKIKERLNEETILREWEDFCVTVAQGVKI